jgi:exopolysaccharide biosynthesis protein
MIRSLTLSLLLLLSTGAFAADDWEPVAPGVDYRHFKGSGVDVHVARIDLRNDAIRVIASEEAERGMRVSEFAKRNRALIAINADYFDKDMKPIGLAVGPCGQWKGTRDTTREGTVAFCDGKAEIRTQRDVMDPPDEWISAAVSGWPILVRNCDALSSKELPGSDGFTRAPHPRTAVGVSKNGYLVYFVVAEGRHEDVGGMTLPQLAEFMEDELGVCTAMNMDGGGSSAMWVDDRIINHPSDGSERRVSNHLAVILRAEDNGCDAPVASGARR